MTELESEARAIEARLDTDGAHEAARWRSEASQIESLFEEIRGLAPPPVIGRVELILRRVVELHGHGLRAMIAHARDAGADGGRFDALVCADELLASLLVLHGLHPQPIDQRIRAALAEAAERVGGDHELVAVDGDRVVVRSAGAPASVIRRAVEEAAPEIMHVEIAGTAPPTDPDLVQIRARPR